MNLSQLIIGLEEQNLVIFVIIARCLCKPILPPSGVSTGSINPHCEECNKRGPTTLALESKGRLTFLRRERAELKDKRLRS